MTPAARLLKRLRVERKLSMRKAGELLGLSDSTIAHIETGRIDVPRGEKLNRMRDREIETVLAAARGLVGWGRNVDDRNSDRELFGSTSKNDRQGALRRSSEEALTFYIGIRE